MKKHPYPTHVFVCGIIILRFLLKSYLGYHSNLDLCVGRIGGDEFVVFLKIPKLLSMERKAQSLVQALCTSSAKVAWQHSILASIGVSLSLEHGNTFPKLYSKADTAMYKTKHEGKNGDTIFC